MKKRTPDEKPRPAKPSLWIISYHMPDAPQDEIVRETEQYPLMEAWRICQGLNEEFPAIPHWLTLVQS